MAGRAEKDVYLTGCKVVADGVVTTVDHKGAARAVDRRAGEDDEPHVHAGLREAHRG
jgi:hypothetical protein